MTEAVLVLVVLLVLFRAVARFHLRGRNLSAFDPPTGQRFSWGAAPGSEHLA